MTYPANTRPQNDVYTVFAYWGYEIAVEGVGGHGYGNGEVQIRTKRTCAGRTKGERCSDTNSASERAMTAVDEWLKKEG